MARQCLDSASNQARTAARSSGVTGVRSFIAAAPIVRSVASAARSSSAASVAGPIELRCRCRGRSATAGGGAGRSPADAPWRRSAPAARCAARPGCRPARAPGRAVAVQNSPVKSSASSPLSLRAAALAHPVLEAVMDLGLQALAGARRPRASRRERDRASTCSRPRCARAARRRSLAIRSWKPKPARDDADRAHDRGAHRR